MKIIHYKHNLLIYGLVIMQAYLITSCNAESYNLKPQIGKIGFLGFYLDMDYIKVQSTMDSLLNISELNYFETSDVLGNKQKNLYHNFSEISPIFCAKVNLRGTYITDEKLTSIQLTLCNRSNKVEQGFSFNCDLNKLERLFEIYKEKYGTPTLLDQGEEYDWLSKKISNVYFPGPKGRWVMDKIYFWERGNYIIYFDFGYPESLTRLDNPSAGADIPHLPDSTSAPIIYYVFTQDYIDRLLDKAGSIKGEELNKTNNTL